ncbi:MAG: O-antigen ligase family protein [Patescibacteria group bacterium]|nr:O-antigen ligase family protein [Patescibacteria group bacterium]
MNYFILIIFLGLFGYLAWRNFRLGLALLVFLLPTYFIRFQIGPLPTTLLELYFVVIALIWITKERGLSYRNQNLIKWRLPIFLFLAAATIGVIVSPDKTAALGIWKAYFIEPILFFLILISSLKTREDWKLILNALLASAAAISLFAIFQKATGVAIPPAWLAERRVTSVFGYPNAVGLYLAPLIILAFSLFYDSLREKKYIYSTLYFLSLASSALAIFFSKTEAGWIAAAAGIFIFCVFKKNLRVPAIAAAAILILLIGLTPALRSPVIEKITLQDWSGHVRLVTWSESLEMLKSNAIFGAGLSGYPLKMIKFHQAEYLEIFQYPHNIVLNFWSETGPVGLIAFLWLMALGIVASLKKARQSSLALAMLCIFFAILIHGLVDVPYFKNDLSMMFWLFLAVAFILEKKNETLSRL